MKPTEQMDRRIGLIVILAAAATAPAGAIAAETNRTGDEALEDVIVVGNRFMDRSMVDSAVPIDVLNAADIGRTGFTDTSKIVQALVPSFNLPHPTTPDGNTHVRSATLRGLSPDQTLVLVNGKRRHTTAWVNVGGTVGRGAVSTDLNAIPPSAIRRIEVLRDGASAQYGSDAIAGVINIVLREDVGLDGSLDYLAVDQGSADTVTAALNGGVGWGDDGAVFGTLYYRTKEAVSRALPDTRQLYFGRSPSGVAVALSDRFGSGIGLNPPGGPAGTTLDPREAGVDRSRLWRFADSADIEEKTALFNARRRLDFAGGSEFYAFGGWRDSAGSSNASLRRPGQPEVVRALYPDGFLPFVDTDSTDASLGVGLRGDAGRWQWDLSSVYGSNELEYRTRNTLNATLGIASPTAFYNGAFEATQWTTNLDLRTEVDAGLPAPLRLAAGVEWRRDGYQIRPGEPDSYRFGPVRVLDGPAAGTIPTIGSQGFAGIQPIDATDRSRHNASVYLEGETDLAESLLVSAAARFEDYSDFGSTTNGKLALRWRLPAGLAARASISSGFHAPALAQQYFSSTSSRTLNNPVTGVPEFVLVRTAPVDTIEARGLGATRLKPEKAFNWTAGLTYESTAFAATLDYYRIAIDDRILLSSNFVDAAGRSSIRDLLASLGSPGVTSVRYFTNAADTLTRGFDLSARYTLETTGAGRFVGTLGFNRNTTSLEAFDPTPAALLALGVRTPLLDVIERTRIERGQPRDSLRLSLDWTLGPVNVVLRTARFGEIRGAALTNQTAANVALFRQGRTDFVTLPTEAGTVGNFDVIQILEPKWVTDVELSYAPGDALQFSAGVQNVADTYPTRNIASTPAALGADTFGAFPYSELSPFGWSGRQYYGRIRFRF